MANDGWMYQGRQYHQWFGHGTKPFDDTAAPATLDERIRTLGMTVVASLRPAERRHRAATFDAATLAQFGTVMRALVRTQDEPQDAVAEQLLGLSVGHPATQYLRQAASLVAEAKTSEDMHQAADALAQGMRGIGLHHWQAQLGKIAGNIKLVANADDPRGNGMVRQIANSLGMSVQQRRILHDSITGQDYKREQIIAIAREIIRDYPNK